MNTGNTTKTVDADLEGATTEAKAGLSGAELRKNLPSTFESRKARRDTLRKIQKYLPHAIHEMVVTQEAFDNNFPGELEIMTEEDRWDLLSEENKTRKAVYFKRLFQVELFVEAYRKYIDTQGKVDMLMDLKMTVKDAMKKQDYDKKLEATSPEDAPQVSGDTESPL